MGFVEIAARERFSVQIEKGETEKGDAVWICFDDTPMVALYRRDADWLQAIGLPAALQALGPVVADTQQM